MNLNDYTVTLEYPPSKPRPVPPRNPTTQESLDWARAVATWADDEAKADVQRKAWQNAQNEALSRFMDDVLREYGLDGHPKANKVYAIAWDEGHAWGLREVEMWVEKLARLVLE